MNILYIPKEVKEQQEKYSKELDDMGSGQTSSADRGNRSIEDNPYLSAQDKQLMAEKGIKNDGDIIKKQMERLMANAQTTKTIFGKART